MSSYEKIREENDALRASLEKKSPGCTAKFATPKKNWDLDLVLAEGDALAKVEAALASQASVSARGASVAAKYLPQPASPPTALVPDVSKMSLSQRGRLLNQTDAAILAGRNSMRHCKPGSAEHRELTAKLAGLEKTKASILATLAKPGAKTPTEKPANAEKKLTMTERCLQRKGLPPSTRVALTPPAAEEIYD